MIVVLFLGYFFYEFTVAKDFNNFKAYTPWQFLLRLLR